MDPSRRNEPPPTNTQNGSAVGTATPTKPSIHKCPCKRTRSPDCDCPHEPGCKFRSTRPKPTTPLFAKSPFRRGKYGSGATGSTASPTRSNAFAGANRSTLHSPMTIPSAYDFGYDGSMTLYDTMPLHMPTMTKGSGSVSVIKDLPYDITRTFGGRVERKKKRPKDIKVPKPGESSDGKPCVCDMECSCRCWTLHSPIATKHSPMFDRDVIR